MIELILMNNDVNVHYVLNEALFCTFFNKIVFTLMTNYKFSFFKGNFFIFFFQSYFAKKDKT